MPSILSSSNEILSSRPVRVMLEALQAKRLSHSLIISGENRESVETTGHHLAAKILTGHDSPLALTKHPDFFPMRPAGKMRQISAGNTRDLIRDLSHSAREGGSKVAIFYDADRMNESAANIFLKTLEEPPADTTILLLTSRPNFLLSTIRSRCLHFRLPDMAEPEDLPEPLKLWLADYSAWLERMAEIPGSKHDICDRIIGLYGLLARFSPLLKTVTAESWKDQKESLPENISNEEEEALAEGLKISLRDQFFTALEHRLRAFARPRLGDPAAARAFTESTDCLERTASLLRLNINESVALEAFLLAALRHWGRRKQAA